MTELTDRQAQVLGWIQRYVAEHGIAPSIREIGEGLGITSLRGVTVHLAVLAKKGYIEVKPGTPRGIVVRGPRSDAWVAWRDEVVEFLSSLEYADVLDKISAESLIQSAPITREGAA